MNLDFVRFQALVLRLAILTADVRCRVFFRDLDQFFDLGVLWAAEGRKVLISTSSVVQVFTSHDAQVRDR